MNLIVLLYYIKSQINTKGVNNGQRNFGEDREDTVKIFDSGADSDDSGLDGIDSINHYWSDCERDLH